MIVTRVANLDNDDLGTDIFKELVSDPRVPGIAAVVVLAMGAIPGFPTLVFAGIAAALLLSAMLLRATIRRREEADAEIADAAAADAEREAADPSSARILLILGKETATDLDLADLEQRIAEKFARLHATRGIRFPLPGVETSDRYGSDAICVESDEVPVFRDTVPPDQMPVRGDDDLSGIVAAETGHAVETIDWFDLRGVWLPVNRQDIIDGLGYEILAPEGALAHLAFRVYERNLGALFSNTVFGELLETMQANDPETMREIDDKITRPALYRLVRYLVEDGVPVRPLPLLIGSLHYWLHSLESPTAVTLAECLRGSMKRQLCHRIAGPDGVLGVILVDPALEATMRRSIQEARRATDTPAEEGLTLSPQVNEAILKQLRDITGGGGGGGGGIERSGCKKHPRLFARGICAGGCGTTWRCKISIFRFLHHMSWPRR